MSDINPLGINSKDYMIVANSLSRGGTKQSQLVLDTNQNYFYFIDDDTNITRLFEPSFINLFAYGTSSVTTMTASNTYYKLNVNTTVGYSRNGLSSTIANKISYSSQLTKIFKMECIISLSSANNNEIHVAFFKNGEILPCSEQELVTDSSGKLGAIPNQCLVELSTGDYVEVWAKNKTASNNITVSNYNLIITET